MFRSGEKIGNDLGSELGLTVFVTSRRYCQTNSAQALKETSRFTLPMRFSLGFRLGFRLGDRLGDRLGFS